MAPVAPPVPMPMAESDTSYGDEGLLLKPGFDFGMDNINNATILRAKLIAQQFEISDSKAHRVTLKAGGVGKVRLMPNWIASN